MHDRFFEEQAALPRADFPGIAAELGLDVVQFQRDMASTALGDLIAQDETLARHFGINSTPSAFVNGRPVRGAASLAEFDEVVQAERTKAQALVGEGTAPAEVYDAVMRAAKPQVE